MTSRNSLWKIIVLQYLICRSYRAMFLYHGVYPNMTYGLIISVISYSKANRHHVLRLIPCMVMNLRPGIRKLYIVSGVCGLVGLMINYIRITDRYECDSMWCMCW